MVLVALLHEPKPHHPQCRRNAHHEVGKVCEDTIPGTHFSHNNSISLCPCSLAALAAPTRYHPPVRWIVPDLQALLSQPP